MKQTSYIPELLFCFVILAQFACSKPCTKNLDHAPELRGFRLGTDISQIQNRFNGFPTFLPNEFGMYRMVIRAEPIAEQVKPGDGYYAVSVKRYAELDGTERIILEFVDGKLAKIKVYYRDDLNWQSVDEFVKQISKSLELPDGWETSRHTQDYQTVFCNGFFVRAGRDNETYSEPKVPFVELANTLESLQPVFRELNSNENKNRKEEERRRTFRP